MRLAPDSGRNAFPQENREEDVLPALSCEDARLLTLVYGNSVEDYQLPGNSWSGKLSSRNSRGIPGFDTS
jgi:hypothetical protein